MTPDEQHTRNHDDAHRESLWTLVLIGVTIALCLVGIAVAVYLMTGHTFGAPALEWDSPMRPGGVTSWITIRRRAVLTRALDPEWHTTVDITGCDAISMYVAGEKIAGERCHLDLSGADLDWLYEGQTCNVSGCSEWIHEPWIWCTVTRNGDCPCHHPFASDGACR